VSEIDMQRVQTDAFIQGNPTEIILVPRIRVQNPNGGWTWVKQVARDLQTFRLITANTGQTVTTSNGVERTVDYELFGSWDAVVALGDVFTVDSDPYEVVSMYPANGYSVRALVSRQMDAPPRG
jgi:hypothetical protein